MIDIEVNHKKLQSKKGDYKAGDARHLADPAFLARAQEYRRSLSLSMKTLPESEISKVPRAKGIFVTRKYDGEFTLLGYDGKKVVSVNPGGTVRMGLPCYIEAEQLLKKAEIGSCLLAGEIYVRDENPEALAIHQVVRKLRAPSSEADLKKLGFAVFDILEIDGSSLSSVKDVFSGLSKLFGKGKLVHPVDNVTVNDHRAISEKFDEWVKREGNEGIVIRHDTLGLYKIKTRHNLDLAVIGFSVGTDSRKGMLHDLLTAVVRPDGTFQEIARVGGGFSDEDRRTIAGTLRKKIVPSEYVAVNNDLVAYEMVRPETVIEISCLDLITERARGGPINRMVLEWDGKRYKALSRLPLVSLISPQFIRIRDDKEAGVEDTSIRQLTQLVPVQEVESSADRAKQPGSELLKREVHVKSMKGNTMVRKLLMWKTNKEKTGDFPAYVVYLTDFSPNRETPLERDVRFASTKALAENMFRDLAAENFIGGWEKAG